MRGRKEEGKKEGRKEEGKKQGRKKRRVWCVFVWKDMQSTHSHQSYPNQQPTHLANQITYADNLQHPSSGRSRFCHICEVLFGYFC